MSRMRGREKRDRLEAKSTKGARWSSREWTGPHERRVEELFKEARDILELDEPVHVHCAPDERKRILREIDELRSAAAEIEKQLTEKNRKISKLREAINALNGSDEAKEAAYGFVNRGGIDILDHYDRGRYGTLPDGWKERITSLAEEFPGD